MPQLHAGGKRPIARRQCATLAVATLLIAVSCASPAGAALCGDTNGDGFFTASDALASLRLAVSSGYDRRGDVVPRAAGAVAEAGDGKVAAGDALEALRASVEARIPPCRGATEKRAAVTTGAYDFSSAGFAVVDLASHAFEYRGGSLNGDAVIRAPRGIPVVVNRHNYNTLQILDADDANLATINDCSVSDGFNSNPQDVLLLSDSKGYVTPYAGGDLLVISPPVLFEPELDPACSSIIMDRIDLSAFDSDGVPEMDQMVAVGSKIYVSIQRLDEGHQPTKGNGAIVVIDSTTDSVVTSIPLSFANPFAETKGLPWDEFQQRIFVGGPGDIHVLGDGGIEAVDPAGMVSAGMLMTGADIGANIFDFVVVGSRRAFAIVADDDSNSVVDLDIGPAPADRRIRKTLLSSTALITDIEMTQRGELWVAYRGETKDDPPGLRVFRVTDDAEITTTPITLGQAPFTLAFIE